MNKYDLEQDILNAWQIVTDLNLLSSSISEDQIDKDEILNILIGLQSLYNLKFDKLFRDFEKIMFD